MTSLRLSMDLLDRARTCVAMISFFFDSQLTGHADSDVLPTHHCLLTCP